MSQPPRSMTRLSNVLGTQMSRRPWPAPRRLRPRWSGVTHQMSQLPRLMTWLSNVLRVQMSCRPWPEPRRLRPRWSGVTHQMSQQPRLYTIISLSPPFLLRPYAIAAAAQSSSAMGHVTGVTPVMLPLTASFALALRSCSQDKDYCASWNILLGAQII